MPWREVSVMEERREFIGLAQTDACNIRELCRRFGISANVGYKWLKRWKEGDRELSDRSRRPHTNPLRCSARIEARVLAVRDAHPAWGARKIWKCLEREGFAVPAISTVHAILCRRGLIDHDAPSALRTYSRFEKEAPNLLWQMDFKGAVTLSNGTRCHPLTMIDDHSRFVPCLEACSDQQTETVKAHLERTFRHYGLPAAMFADNGSPWGSPGTDGWTKLGVWLVKLGIFLIHSKIYHPQSRGKNERFHRTLKAEVFAFETFKDMRQVQHAFDRWLEVYNFQRPHQALDLNVPASRYRPSPRPMPERVPEVEYDEHEIVRTVPSTKAYISFKGQLWKVPQAFCGERVAVRALDGDGNYGIFFASYQIANIDLRRPARTSCQT